MRGEWKPLEPPSSKSSLHHGPMETMLPLVKLIQTFWKTEKTIPKIKPHYTVMSCLDKWKLNVFIKNMHHLLYTSWLSFNWRSSWKWNGSWGQTNRILITHMIMIWFESVFEQNLWSESSLFEYPFNALEVKGQRRWQRANNGSVQSSPPEIGAAIQRDWHTKDCEFSHSSTLKRTKDFIYHS